MRKVLLISHFFPPCAASGSFRLSGFARHLPAQGWQMHVVSASGMPDEPEDPGLLETLPPGLENVRVAYPAGKLGSLARKLVGSFDVIDRHVIWVPAALRTAEHLIARERPQVIMTSGPPHSAHYAGLALRRKHGIPWLADLRDPIAFGIAWRFPWYGRLSRQAFEHAVFEHADRVVLNAPGAERVFHELYPNLSSKGTVIPNGFDPEDFPAPERRPEGTLRIVHTGETYNNRDPRCLFDVVAKLIKEGRIGALALEFVGRHSDASYDPLAYCKSLGIADHVAYTPQVGSKQARQRMSDADILLMLDSPGRRQGVPAKLYEYLGAQRPILALAEPAGDAGWVLQQSGVLHGIAPPTDRAGIEAALLHLLDHKGGPTASDGRLGFSRRVLSERLARELEALAR